MKKRNFIFGIPLLFLVLNQISCTNRSESGSKAISARVGGTGPIIGDTNILGGSSDTCDNEGGDVDNFGIIGGRTISQKSPLARGVVKLYVEYFDSATKKVVGGSNCTGALIDANIILTAAHCVQAPAELSTFRGSLRQRVYALYGSNPICKVEKGDLSRLFLVDSIKMHENFGKADGNGDIALLRIEKPMTGEHTFYKLDAQTHDFKADDNLIAIGYGKTQGYNVKEDMSAPLKFARLGSNKKESFEKEFIIRVFNSIPTDNKKAFYDNFEAELQKQNQQADRATIEATVDEYLKKTFIKEAFFNYTDFNENLLFDQSNNEGVCAGDSGGPGLRVAADALRIVGVAKSVSAYNDHDDSCSFSTLYTNVSFHKAWIIKNYNELANKDSVVRRKGELLFE